MKPKRIFFIFLIGVFSFLGVFSSGAIVLNLFDGKNIVEFNSAGPFYVKTFVELNPSIEVISYIGDNETIGYINIFGGIGDNFIIQENRKYEIVVRENLTVVLPYRGSE